MILRPEKLVIEGLLIRIILARLEPNIGDRIRVGGSVVKKDYSFDKSRLSSDVKSPSPARREFLKGSAVGIVAQVAGLRVTTTSAEAAEIEPQEVIMPVSGRKRQKQAYDLRFEVGQRQRELPVADHPPNGDEERYPNKIASYTKALPHNNLGEVDLAVYTALIRALSSGQPADFEAVPPGGPRRLINPRAGLAFKLEGPDSRGLTIAGAQIRIPNNAHEYNSNYREY